MTTGWSGRCRKVPPVSYGVDASSRWSSEDSPCAPDTEARRGCARPRPSRMTSRDRSADGRAASPDLAIKPRDFADRVLPSCLTVRMSRLLRSAIVRVSAEATFRAGSATLARRHRAQAFMTVAACGPRSGRVEGIDHMPPKTCASDTPAQIVTADALTSRIAGRSSAPAWLATLNLNRCVYVTPVMSIRHNNQLMNLLCYNKMTDAGLILLRFALQHETFAS